jgi:hypothetical protein
VNANVTGNPENLAVFIWVNSTSHVSGNIELIDVQIESGAIATPFERKTFQEQLADCQRYFFRIQSEGTVATLGYGLANSAGTALHLNVPLPVEMRVRPTLALVGVPEGFDGSVGRAFTAISSQFSTRQTASGNPSYSGGTFNASRPVLFYAATSGTGMTASAEL